MARTRHTNLADFEGAQGLPLPLSARRRIQFTLAVTRAATVRHPADPKASAVRCIARVARGLCGEWVHVVVAVDVIAWSCPGCAENGFVSGFVGSPYDLSAFRRSEGPAVGWGLDEESYRVLVATACDKPWMTAVLARGTPRADGLPVDLEVVATPDEMERIYQAVSELAVDPARRPNAEVLERIQLSLADAMDRARRVT